MQKLVTISAVLCCLLAAVSHGSVLFSEDWNSGIINPTTWSVAEVGPTNISLKEISAGDYALVLQGQLDGPVPQWGDQIYSMATYDRDGFVSITFKTWEGNANVQYGSYAGFHKNNVDPVYHNMEAAIGYVWMDLRAAGGEDGDNGLSPVIGTNQMPGFNGGIIQTTSKANAITFRITLGDVSGARWEWSKDNGATWTVERDTIGDSLASNIITNYLGFGPLDGQYGTAMIDDIVVEQKYYLIRQSGGNTAVSEDTLPGPTSDTYTVVLGSSLAGSPPTANVVVTVDPDNKLQVNGAGQGNPVSLTFTPANYNVPQTVTVTAINNTTIEGPNDIGIIAHTSASADPRYNNMTMENVVVNIADDDQVGFVIVESGGSTNVTEGSATTDSYTITALGKPTATVTLTIDPDNQLTVAGLGQGVAQTRTFLPTNWTTPKTVVVGAFDDTLSEGPHTGTITHTSACTDSRWNNLVIPSVVAHITDNEHYCGEPGQVYSPADFNHDCKVNFIDLTSMTAKWLNCTNLFEPGCHW